MSVLTRVKLDEIASSVDYGHTAPSTNEAVGPKFLRITDIQDGFVDWNSVPFCECSSTEETASRLQPGDIVFARTGATTGKSFLIKDCPDRAVFASYLIRVRAKPIILPDYLAHFFKTPDYWSQISLNARGAAQLGVNATSLKSLLIPLPPIAEQKRIAAILDKAEELRGLRRKVLEELDAIVQSIFLEMFGDPILNSKGWEVKSMDDCAERIQIGPFGTQLHEEDYVDDGIPLINPMHIQNGRIVPNFSFSVSPEKHQQLSQYHLKADDVILGRRGEMGRCAVISKAEDKWLCGTGSLFIRPKPVLLHSIYLFFLLSSQSIKKYLEKASQGVTMANLNKTIVSQISIPLPPTALQQEFARRVEAIEQLKVTHRESLAQLDALFASLQHRAFRGEL